MVEIHIVAGLLALLAGGIALFSPKGQYVHRRSGLVFVGAMTVLTASAAVIAQFISPNRVNVMAALLTFYLVCTALLTVTRRVDEVRRLTAAFAILAFLMGVRALVLMSEALGNQNRLVDQVPYQPLIIFASVGFLGALLDLRMLVKGSIQGAQRLIRHLWRMTFALWIATASFFLGQADEFPEPVRRISLLVIPVLVVLLMLFYWLGRVAVTRMRAT